MHIFVNSGEYSMLASITVDRYASAKLTGPNKFSNIMNKCGHRRRMHLTNVLDSEF